MGYGVALIGLIGLIFFAGHMNGRNMERFRWLEKMREKEEGK